MRGEFPIMYLVSWSIFDVSCCRELFCAVIWFSIFVCLSPMFVNCCAKLFITLVIESMCLSCDSIFSIAPMWFLFMFSSLKVVFSSFCITFVSLSVVYNLCVSLFGCVVLFCLWNWLLEVSDVSDDGDVL